MRIRVSGPHIVAITSIAAYLVYIYSIGPQRVVGALTGISLLSVVLIIATILSAITMHALAWHMIIMGSDTGREVRYRDVLGITSLALLSSYIVPVGAVTEVARFVLATQRLGLGASETVSSIMIHRLYTSVSVFLVLLVVFVVRALLGPGTLISLSEALIILFYLVLVVVPNIGLTGLFGSRLFKRLLEVSRRVLERLYRERPLVDPDLFIDRYRSSLRNTVLSMYSVAAFLVSAGEWLFLTLTMYILVTSLLPGTDPLYALMIALTLQLIYWVMPVSVSGMVGPMEFIMTLVLQVIGLAPYIAVGFVITYRILTFLTLVVLSYPAARSLGVGDIRGLLKRGSVERPPG